MAPYFLLYEKKKHSGLLSRITLPGDCQLLCLHPSGKQGLVELLFISKLDNGNYLDDL